MAERLHWTGKRYVFIDGEDCGQPYTWSTSRNLQIFTSLDEVCEQADKCWPWDKTSGRNYAIKVTIALKKSLFHGTVVTMLAKEV